MKMKIGKRIISLACILLSLAIISGCGKKKVEPGATSSSIKPEGHLIGERKSTNDIVTDTFGAGEMESLDKTGRTPFGEDTTTSEYQRTYGRSTAPLLPVYFDFDSNSINADQFDTLNADGAYLIENETTQLVIEGNCDERGTADYNLALGELRAINVKKYLVNLGIDSGRISTISYGSQRPLFSGNDETSWAANRRADLVIP
jgi:peptidoglycan-associated lipoprotein